MFRKVMALGRVMMMVTGVGLLLTRTHTSSINNSSSTISDTSSSEGC